MRVLQRSGRRVAALQEIVERHAVLGSREQPRRVAAVAPLVANHRPRPHDQLEAVLARELEKVAEITTRARAADEVIVAIRKFVPIPDYVEIERIDSERPKSAHRARPLTLWQSLVEKRGTVNEEPFGVDFKDGKVVTLDDRGVRERICTGGAAEEEQNEERCSERERPLSLDFGEDQIDDRSDQQGQEPVADGGTPRRKEDPQQRKT